MSKPPPAEARPQSGRSRPAGRLATAGSGAGFVYRPEVLEALAQHGVQPTPASDPRRVYELVKSLYTWEIRKLKADFRKLDPGFGRATRARYAEANRRLLGRYSVLRLPPHEWIER